MTAPVLVTGATGFLGRHVIDALIGGGQKVRALVRQKSRSLEKLGCELAIGDVEDGESIAAALPGVEQVYHLAGVVSRDAKDATRMMRVHVDGTRNLLVACRGTRRRVVVASSSGTIAVSRDPDVVATEDSPHALDVVKGWPYYLSKIYQERLALDPKSVEGVEVVVLNPSLLLGPGDQRGTSTEDVLRFLQKKIPILPDGGINFVDVRDAARAFVAAMAKGRPGEKYLLGGPNWSLATFFGRLERLSKVSAPKLRLPPSWARFGASVMERVAEWRGSAPPVDRISVEMSECFWYLDASKAQRELGFEARDPQETLLDTVRWLREKFM